MGPNWPDAFSLPAISRSLGCLLCPESPAASRMMACLGCGKGDKRLLCEASEGPFRQKAPVTFSAAGETLKWQRGLLLGRSCIVRTGPVRKR
jgi:hypothetical protein